MAMLPEQLRPLPINPVPARDRVFVGGFNFFVDWVVPLALAGLVYGRGAAPLSRMMKGVGALQPAAHGTLLRLEAEGHSGGREKRLALTLGHPDGYLMTAARRPAARCWTARPPAGLHTRRSLEPERMLRYERMGVDLRLEENPVNETGQGWPASPPCLKANALY